MTAVIMYGMNSSHPIFQEEFYFPKNCNFDLLKSKINHYEDVYPSMDEVAVAIRVDKKIKHFCFFHRTLLGKWVLS